MKRIVFTLILIFSLAVNSFSQNIFENKKILIAYFTWADNTVPFSEIDGIAASSALTPGNTAVMAGDIQKILGGDILLHRLCSLF